MELNNSIEILLNYFHQLTDVQQRQFAQLYDLYLDWNEKINVISRKDIHQLYERHVLHSLSISRFVHFRDQAKVLDVGTGGGFPGIPLAILFPEVQFTLIDSIGKKIRVAEDVAAQIGLTNVRLLHENAKEEKGKYDFVVSRAVMNAAELVKLIQKNISKKHVHSIPNGLICLKGGELDEEISALKRPCEVVNLSDYFQEEFFETKKIMYVPIPVK